MTYKKDGFGHEKPHEGETNDWITPKWIIEAFDSLSEDGMFFDLDPCSSLTQPWIISRKAYTIEQDGLKNNWFGTVYCNPPYGQNVGLWANKMAQHSNGVMLIFARLETSAWFDNIFNTADGFLFIRGRIVFHKPDGSLPKNKKGQIASAGAPSALVAWGSKCRNALIELCDRGMLDEFGVMRESAFLDKAFYTGSKEW